jgi:hypothetical protein
MRRLLKSLWVDLRRKWFPKRLYRYGNLGLAYFDDRSRTEKVCDWIDKAVEYELPRLRDTAIWHSYFDYSLGRKITSYSELREEEKKGKARMTFEEAERLGARYRERSKKELKEKIRQGVREALHEVKQGRSFHREILKQIPGDMALKEARMKAAQGMK